MFNKIKSFDTNLINIDKKKAFPATDAASNP